MRNGATLNGLAYDRRAATEDLIAWTEGRALVATGSPFPPVEYDGRTIAIGRRNNMFIFPGVGLGALAAGAQHITDEMFVAAASALSACSPARHDPSASLYPPVEAVREVAYRVALAVGAAAVAAGEADPLSLPDELERRIADTMWTPRYAAISYRAQNAGG